MTKQDLIDNTRWIFDLDEGDTFRARDRYGKPTVMEVISPLDKAGIPYGFGILANTWRVVRRECVYAVDTRRRTNIYEFDTNRKVIPC